MTEFAYILFLLLAGHALADYPLQGDFLAQAKNRNTEIGRGFWLHALFAHSVIHGGFVLVITESVLLASLETIIHAAADWLKCEKKISLNTDQSLHIVCKVIWAALVTQRII